MFCMFCLFLKCIYRCICACCCCCCKKSKEKGNKEPLVDGKADVYLTAPLQDKMEKGVLHRGPDVLFPRPWRERHCVMTTWMYFSLVTYIFTFYTCPVGLVCGIIGGSIYTCRCCKPHSDTAGLRASTVIYSSALCAVFFDILVAVTLSVFAFYYEFAKCTLSKQLCQFKELIAFGMFVISGILMIHALFSLNTFLSMRDCHYDIIRERLLEARVKDMAQLKADEMYRNYKRKKRMSQTTEFDEFDDTKFDTGICPNIRPPIY